jgi:hypothetical protein
MSVRVVTIYTVRRWPVTAAAKSSTGYGSHEFEFVADSAKDATAKAIAECEWRNATENFGFQTVASRVVVLDAPDTGSTDSDLADN